VAATLDEIRQSNQACSTHHRIIDVQRRVRDVVAISDRLYDRDGAVIGTGLVRGRHTIGRSTQ
jgi:hypothetical protein